jgi:cell division protein FtsW (lipid II flippase)
MALESEHIAPDGAALRFVLGCAGSLGRRRIIGWVGEESGMSNGLARLGLVCGTAAMAVGLMLMALEGAPSSYLAVNALTGVVALLAFPVFVRLLGFLCRWPARSAAALAALLLATALLGTSLDGVTRWVRLGPVSLQVSFLALPILIGLAARLDAARAAPAVVLAAFALALQPDRAMAAALLAAVAVIAARRFDRGWTALLGVCALGFGAAMLRQDPMPALPFVDQLIPFAIAAHGWLGAAVAAAMLITLLPFLLGLRAAEGARGTVAVLGAWWSAVTLAAVLGNYPSPFVGFGASPILGYALSFAFLSATMRRVATSGTETLRATESGPAGISRFVSRLRVRSPATLDRAA